MVTLGLTIQAQAAVMRFAGECLEADPQGALRPIDARDAWLAWAAARELPQRLLERRTPVRSYLSAWAFLNGAGRLPLARRCLRGARLRPGITPGDEVPVIPQAGPRELYAIAARFAGTALAPDPQAVILIDDLDAMWASWAARAGFPAYAASGRHARAYFRAWGATRASRQPLEGGDRFVHERRSSAEFITTGLTGVRLAARLPMELPCAAREAS